MVRWQLKAGPFLVLLSCALAAVGSLARAAEVVTCDPRAGNCGCLALKVDDIDKLRADTNGATFASMVNGQLAYGQEQLARAADLTLKLPSDADAGTVHWNCFKQAGASGSDHCKMISAFTSCVYGRSYGTGADWDTVEQFQQSLVGWYTAMATAAYLDDVCLNNKLGLCIPIPALNQRINAIKSNPYAGRRKQELPSSKQAGGGGSQGGGKQPPAGGGATAGGGAPPKPQAGGKTQAVGGAPGGAGGTPGGTLIAGFGLGGHGGNSKYGTSGGEGGGENGLPFSGCQVLQKGLDLLHKAPSGLKKLTDIAEGMFNSVKEDHCKKTFDRAESVSEMDPVCDKVMHELQSERDCGAQASPGALDPSSQGAVQNLNFAIRSQELIESAAKSMLEHYIPAYLEMFAHKPGMSAALFERVKRGLLLECKPAPGYGELKSFVNEQVASYAADFADSGQNLEKAPEEYAAKLEAAAYTLKKQDEMIDALWQDFGGGGKGDWHLADWYREHAGVFAMCVAPLTIIDDLHNGPTKGQCTLDQFTLASKDASLMYWSKDKGCSPPTLEGVKATIGANGGDQTWNPGFDTTQATYERLKDNWDQYLGKWTDADRLVASMEFTNEKSGAELDQETNAAAGDQQREQDSRQAKEQDELNQRLLKEFAAKGTKCDVIVEVFKGGQSVVTYNSGNTSHPRVCRVPMGGGGKDAPPAPPPVVNPKRVVSGHDLNGPGMCWRDRCKVKEAVLKRLIEERGQLLGQYPELVHRYNDKGEADERGTPLYLKLLEQSDPNARRDAIRKELGGVEASADAKAISDVIATLCGDPVNKTEKLFSDDAMMEELLHCRDKLTEQDKNALQGLPAELRGRAQARMEGQAKRCQVIKSDRAVACQLRNKYLTSMTTGAGGLTSHGQQLGQNVAEGMGMYMDAAACLPIFKAIGAGLSFAGKAARRVAAGAVAEVFEAGGEAGLRAATRVAAANLRRGASSLTASALRGTERLATRQGAATAGNFAWMQVKGAGLSLFHPQILIQTLFMNAMNSYATYGWTPAQWVSDAPFSGDMQKTIADCRAHLAPAESCAYFQRSVASMWAHGMIYDMFLGGLAFGPLHMIAERGGMPEAVGRPAMTPELRGLWASAKDPAASEASRQAAIDRFLEAARKQFAGAVGLRPEQIGKVFDRDAQIKVFGGLAEAPADQVAYVPREQRDRLKLIFNDPETVQWINELSGEGDLKGEHELHTAAKVKKALAGIERLRQMKALTDAEALKYTRQIESMIDRVLAASELSPDGRKPPRKISYRGRKLAEKVRLFEQVLAGELAQDRAADSLANSSDTSYRGAAAPAASEPVAPAARFIPTGSGLPPDRGYALMRGVDYAPSVHASLADLEASLAPKSSAAEAEAGGSAGGAARSVTQEFSQYLAEVGKAAPPARAPVAEKSVGPALAPSAVEEAKAPAAQAPPPVEVAKAPPAQTQPPVEELKAPPATQGTAGSVATASTPRVPISQELATMVDQLRASLPPEGGSREAASAPLAQGAPGLAAPAPRAPEAPAVGAPEAQRAPAAVAAADPLAGVSEERLRGIERLGLGEFGGPAAGIRSEKTLSAIVDQLIANRRAAAEQLRAEAAKLAPESPLRAQLDEAAAKIDVSEKTAASMRGAFSKGGLDPAAKFDPTNPKHVNLVRSGRSAVLGAIGEAGVAARLGARVEAWGRTVQEMVDALTGKGKGAPQKEVNKKYEEIKAALARELGDAKQAKAALGREIDVIFRTPEGKTAWGEVKNVPEPLDVGHEVFEKLKSQIEIQGKIARALGLDVEQHAFVENGLTPEARAQLEAMGVKVHVREGVTVARASLPPEKAPAVFEGPELTPTRPSPEELEAARDYFGNPAGKTDARARAAEQAMLNDVVASDHGYLGEIIRAYSRLEEGQKPFDPDCVGGSCGLGQSDVYHRVQEFLKASRSPEGSVKIHLIQALATFGGNKHGFAVVEFPSGRAYLVDTTFRQFLNPKTTEVYQGGAVGKYMRSQPGGDALADALAKHGFVELTDAVANLYGRSMLAGDGPVPAGKRFTVADLLRDSARLEHSRSDWQGWGRKARAKLADNLKGPTEEPVRSPGQGAALIAWRDRVPPSDLYLGTEPDRQVSGRAEFTKNAERIALEVESMRGRPDAKLIVAGLPRRGKSTLLDRAAKAWESAGKGVAVKVTVDARDATASRCVEQFFGAMSDRGADLGVSEIGSRYFRFHDDPELERMAQTGDMAGAIRRAKADWARLGRRELMVAVDELQNGANGGAWGGDPKGRLYERIMAAKDAPMLLGYVVTPENAENDTQVLARAGSETGSRLFRIDPEDSGSVRKYVDELVKGTGVRVSDDAVDAIVEATGGMPMAINRVLLRLPTDHAVIDRRAVADAVDLVLGDWRETQFAERGAFAYQPIATPENPYTPAFTGMDWARFSMIRDRVAYIETRPEVEAARARILSNRPIWRNLEANLGQAKMRVAFGIEDPLKTAQTRKALDEVRAGSLAAWRTIAETYRTELIRRGVPASLISIEETGSYHLALVIRPPPEGSSTKGAHFLVKNTRIFDPSGRTIDRPIELRLEGIDEARFDQQRLRIRVPVELAFVSGPEAARLSLGHEQKHSMVYAGHSKHDLPIIQGYRVGGAGAVALPETWVKDVEAEAFEQRLTAVGDWPKYSREPGYTERNIGRGLRQYSDFCAVDEITEAYPYGMRAALGAVNDNVPVWEGKIRVFLSAKIRRVIRGAWAGSSAVELAEEAAAMQDALRSNYMYSVFHAKAGEAWVKMLEAARAQVVAGSDAVKPYLDSPSAQFTKVARPDGAIVRVKHPVLGETIELMFDNVKTPADVVAQIDRVLPRVREQITKTKERIPGIVSLAERINVMYESLRKAVPEEKLAAARAPGQTKAPGGAQAKSIAQRVLLAFGIGKRGTGDLAMMSPEETIKINLPLGSPDQSALGIWPLSPEAADLILADAPESKTGAAPKRAAPDAAPKAAAPEATDTISPDARKWAHDLMVDLEDHAPRPRKLSPDERIYIPARPADAGATAEYETLPDELVESIRSGPPPLPPRRADAGATAEYETLPDELVESIRSGPPPLPPRRADAGATAEYETLPDELVESVREMPRSLPPRPGPLPRFYLSDEEPLPRYELPGEKREAEDRAATDAALSRLAKLRSQAEARDALLEEEHQAFLQEMGAARAPAAKESVLEPEARQAAGRAASDRLSRLRAEHDAGADGFWASLGKRPLKPGDKGFEATRAVMSEGDRVLRNLDRADAKLAAQAGKETAKPKAESGRIDILDRIGEAGLTKEAAAGAGRHALDFLDQRHKDSDTQTDLAAERKAFEARLKAREAREAAEDAALDAKLDRQFTKMEQKSAPPRRSWMLAERAAAWFRRAMGLTTPLRAVEDARILARADRLGQIEEVGGPPPVPRDASFEPIRRAMAEHPGLSLGELVALGHIQPAELKAWDSAQLRMLKTAQGELEANGIRSRVMPIGDVIRAIGSGSAISPDTRALVMLPSELPEGHWMRAHLARGRDAPTRVVIDPTRISTGGARAFPQDHVLAVSPRELVKARADYPFHAAMVEYDTFWGRGDPPMPLRVQALGGSDRLGGSRDASLKARASHGYPSEDIEAHQVAAESIIDGTRARMNELLATLYSQVASFGTEGNANLAAKTNRELDALSARVGLAGKLANRARELGLDFTGRADAALAGKGVALPFDAAEGEPSLDRVYSGGGHVFAMREQAHLSADHPVRALVRRAEALLDVIAESDYSLGRAGITRAALERLGLSYEDLKTLGFSREDLEEMPLSRTQPNVAGYRADVLDHAGFARNLPRFAERVKAQAQARRAYESVLRARLEQGEAAPLDDLAVHAAAARMVLTRAELAHNRSVHRSTAEIARVLAESDVPSLRAEIGKLRSAVDRMAKGELAPPPRARRPSLADWLGTVIERGSNRLSMTQLKRERPLPRFALPDESGDFVAFMFDGDNGKPADPTRSSADVAAEARRNRAFSPEVRDYLARHPETAQWIGGQVHRAEMGEAFRLTPADLSEFARGNPRVGDIYKEGERAWEVSRPEPGVIMLTGKLSERDLARGSHPPVRMTNVFEFAGPRYAGFRFEPPDEHIGLVDHRFQLRNSPRLLEFMRGKESALRARIEELSRNITKDSAAHEKLARALQEYLARRGFKTQLIAPDASRGGYSWSVAIDPYSSESAGWIKKLAGNEKVNFTLVFDTYNADGKGAYFSPNQKLLALNWGELDGFGISDRTVHELYHYATEAGLGPKGVAENGGGMPERIEIQMPKGDPVAFPREGTGAFEGPRAVSRAKAAETLSRYENGYMMEEQSAYLKNAYARFQKAVREGRAITRDLESLLRTGKAKAADLSAVAEKLGEMRANVVEKAYEYAEVSKGFAERNERLASVMLERVGRYLEGKTELNGGVIFLQERPGRTLDRTVVVTDPAAGRIAMSFATQPARVGAPEGPASPRRDLTSLRDQLIHNKSLFARRRGEAERLIANALPEVDEALSQIAAVAEQASFDPKYAAELGAALEGSAEGLPFALPGGRGPAPAPRPPGPLAREIVRATALGRVGARTPVSGAYGVDAAASAARRSQAYEASRTDTSEFVGKVLADGMYDPNVRLPSGFPLDGNLAGARKALGLGEDRLSIMKRDASGKPTRRYDIPIRVSDNPEKGTVLVGTMGEAPMGEQHYAVNVHLSPADAARVLPLLVSRGEQHGAYRFQLAAEAPGLARADRLSFEFERPSGARAFAEDVGRLASQNGLSAAAAVPFAGRMGPYASVERHVGTTSQREVVATAIQEDVDGWSQASDHLRSFGVDPITYMPAAVSGAGAEPTSAVADPMAGTPDEGVVSLPPARAPPSLSISTILPSIPANDIGLPRIEGIFDDGKRDPKALRFRDDVLTGRPMFSLGADPLLAPELAQREIELPEELMLGGPKAFKLTGWEPPPVPLAERYGKARGLEELRKVVQEDDETATAIFAEIPTGLSVEKIPAFVEPDPTMPTPKSGLWLRYDPKLGYFIVRSKGAHGGADTLFRHDGDWLQSAGPRTGGEYVVYPRLSARDFANGFETWVRLARGISPDAGVRVAMQGARMRRLDGRAFFFATPEEALSFAEALDKIGRARGLKPTKPAPLAGSGKGIGEFASIARERNGVSSRDKILYALAAYELNPDFDGASLLREEGIDPATFLPEGIQKLIDNPRELAAWKEKYDTPGHPPRKISIAQAYSNFSADGVLWAIHEKYGITPAEAQARYKRAYEEARLAEMRAREFEFIVDRVEAVAARKGTDGRRAPLGEMALEAVLGPVAKRAPPNAADRLLAGVRADPDYKFHRVMGDAIFHRINPETPVDENLPLPKGDVLKAHGARPAPEHGVRIHEIELTTRVVQDRALIERPASVLLDEMPEKGEEKQSWAHRRRGRVTEPETDKPYQVYLRMNPHDFAARLPELLGLAMAREKDFGLKFGTGPREMSRLDGRVFSFSDPGAAVSFAKAVDGLAEADGLSATAPVPLTGKVGLFAAIGRTQKGNQPGWNLEHRDVVALAIHEAAVESAADHRTLLKKLGVDSETLLPTDIREVVDNPEKLLAWERARGLAAPEPPRPATSLGFGEPRRPLGPRDTEPAPGLHDTIPAGPPEGMDDEIDAMAQTVRGSAFSRAVPDYLASSDPLARAMARDPNLSAWVEGQWQHGASAFRLSPEDLDEWDSKGLERRSQIATAYRAMELERSRLAALVHAEESARDSMLAWERAKSDRLKGEAERHERNFRSDVVRMLMIQQKLLANHGIEAHTREAVYEPYGLPVLEVEPTGTAHDHWMSQVAAATGLSPRFVFDPATRLKNEHAGEAYYVPGTEYVVLAWSQASASEVTPTVLHEMHHYAVDRGHGGKGLLELFSLSEGGKVWPPHMDAYKKGYVLDEVTARVLEGEALYMKALRVEAVRRALDEEERANGKLSPERELERRALPAASFEHAGQRLDEAMMMAIHGRGQLDRAIEALRKGEATIEGVDGDPDKLSVVYKNQTPGSGSKIRRITFRAAPVRVELTKKALTGLGVPPEELSRFKLGELSFLAQALHNRRILSDKMRLIHDLTHAKHDELVARFGRAVAREEQGRIVAGHEHTLIEHLAPRPETPETGSIGHALRQLLGIGSPKVPSFGAGERAPARAGLHERAASFFATRDRTAYLEAARARYGLDDAASAELASAFDEAMRQGYDPEKFAELEKKYLEEGSCAAK